MKMVMSLKSLRPLKPLKPLLFIAALLSLASLTGCHKTCVCKGYDGSERRYSDDEVDAHNVTCANMVDQAGRTNFYVVCDWE